MRELALHILDLAQNSIEAGATTIDLSVVEDQPADQLEIVLKDNGRGMDAETAARAIDPFYTTRTTRRQGLGLPLFQAMCERCEGTLELTGTGGQECPPYPGGTGTVVRGRMRLSHLDRPPLGDMGAVVQALACEAGRVRLRYHHRVNQELFELDTAELQARLGDVPVTDPTVLHWLGGFVNDGLREVHSTA